MIPSIRDIFEALASIAVVSGVVLMTYWLTTLG